jgi:hypothetical protein
MNSFLFFHSISIVSIKADAIFNYLIKIKIYDEKLVASIKWTHKRR